MKIEMPVTVCLTDLIDRCDSEELFDFIVAADEAVCDWDFTKSLYDHFAALEKQRIREHEDVKDELEEEEEKS